MVRAKANTYLIDCKLISELLQPGEISTLVKNVCSYVERVGERERRGGCVSALTKHHLHRYLGTYLGT